MTAQQEPQPAATPEPPGAAIPTPEPPAAPVPTLPPPEPQRPAGPAGTSTGSPLVEQPLADPSTAAALGDVVAARQSLADELVRLEASVRAAVDIRAKVRRNPGKAAAAVGGTAFVVLGGPRKVFRSVRHRVFGKPDPLPPSLLPEQIDKAVRALGDDGAKVRGALEVEFARFLQEERRVDRRFTRRLILATAAPLAARGLKELFNRLAATSADDVAAREEAIRARVDGRRKPPTG